MPTINRTMPRTNAPCRSRIRTAARGSRRTSTPPARSSGMVLLLLVVAMILVESSSQEQQQQQQQKLHEKQLPFADQPSEFKNHQRRIGQLLQKLDEHRNRNKDGSDGDATKLKTTRTKTAAEKERWAQDFRAWRKALKDLSPSERKEALAARKARARKEALTAPERLKAEHDHNTELARSEAEELRKQLRALHKNQGSDNDDNPNTNTKTRQFKDMSDSEKQRQREEHRAWREALKKMTPAEKRKALDARRAQAEDHRNELLSRRREEHHEKRRARFQAELDNTRGEL